MFGFTPNNPLSNVWALADLLPNNSDSVALRETWNRARRNLSRFHERVRRFYDRGRRPNNFAVGQLVMVHNYPESRAADRFSAKLSPSFVYSLSVKMVVCACLVGFIHIVVRILVSVFCLF
jgi:hypothetical protein